MKVSSVNCEHVYDDRPGGIEAWAFRVKNPKDGQVIKFHKEWKFCPICGKEALWATSSKETDNA